MALSKVVYLGVCILKQSYRLWGMTAYPQRICKTNANSQEFVFFDVRSCKHGFLSWKKPDFQIMRDIFVDTLFLFQRIREWHGCCIYKFICFIPMCNNYWNDVSKDFCCSLQVSSKIVIRSITYYFIYQL